MNPKLVWRVEVFLGCLVARNEGLKRDCITNSAETGGNEVKHSGLGFGAGEESAVVICDSVRMEQESVPFVTNAGGAGVFRTPCSV